MNVNMQVVAARAAANGRKGRRNRGTVGTDPASRTVAVAPLYSGDRNRRASKMTKAQRNSEGRVSEWNMSPYAPRLGWR